MDAADASTAHRPTATSSVDVAIVGAGLHRAVDGAIPRPGRPQLRIPVLDRHHIGFGASGRNGGWCSGLLANSLTTLAERHGRTATIAMQRRDARHRRRGRPGPRRRGHRRRLREGRNDLLARTPAAARSAVRGLIEARSFGLATDDLRWLEPDEIRSDVPMSAVAGPRSSPRTARWCTRCGWSTPRRGGQAAGGGDPRATPVLEHDRSRARHPAGRVRADVVVWATEAWTVGAAPVTIATSCRCTR